MRCEPAVCRICALVQVHQKALRLYACDRPKLTGGSCEFATYDAGKMSNHKKYSLVHNRRQDFKFFCPACKNRFPRRCPCPTPLPLSTNCQDM